MSVEWIQEEYNEVKAAYIALATGKSVVRVTIDDDTTEFTQRSMPQLRSLLNEMAASLSSTPKPSRSARRKNYGQTLPTDNKNPSSSTAPQRIVMKPGTFPALHNGYKVEFSEPADVGDNYRVFLKTQFLKFSRGLRITYEQLTDDLSDVHFSSIRAGLIEFRRLCNALRLRTLIFQFCRPVINRCTDYAVHSCAV